MTDLIAIAQEKAQKAIARATAEQAVLDTLPKGINAEPRVMLFRGVPHITYTGAGSFADVMHIFDSFDVRDSYDCKGTFRGVYAEPRDDVQHVVQAWIKLQASHNTGSRATFCFHATGADGKVCQVSITFDDSVYGRKYKGHIWSDALGYRFQYIPASRGVRAHYEVVQSASIAGMCDTLVSFNTGAERGAAVCIYGMFADRDQLAAAVATCELAGVPS